VDDENNNRPSDLKLNAPDVNSDSEKMIDSAASAKPAQNEEAKGAGMENAMADPDEIVVELDS